MHIPSDDPVKEMMPSHFTPDQIVQLKDKSSFAKVYFESFKCEMCNNLPAHIIKCPNISCDALYCNDCPFYHKDLKFARECGFKPTCKKCLTPFSHTYSLTKMDHPGVKDLRKNTNPDIAIERNVLQLIENDILVKCHEGGFEGRYELVVRH